LQTGRKLKSIFPRQNLHHSPLHSCLPAVPWDSFPFHSIIFKVVLSSLVFRNHLWPFASLPPLTPVPPVVQYRLRCHHRHTLVGFSICSLSPVACLLSPVSCLLSRLSFPIHLMLTSISILLRLVTLPADPIAGSQHQCTLLAHEAEAAHANSRGFRFRSQVRKPDIPTGFLLLFSVLPGNFWDNTSNRAQRFPEKLMLPYPGI
jgi:hypothetical protein